MGTIKKFLGYDSQNRQFDENGKEYLAETDNPGAMLAIEATLIIKDDNSTFTQEELDYIKTGLYSTYGNKP